MLNFHLPRLVRRDAGVPVLVCIDRKAAEMAEETGKQQVNRTLMIEKTARYLKAWQVFPPTLVQHRLGGADVLNDGFAPAVNVHPASVAYAVLVTGYVDHVATRLGVRHHVMGLLVSDHDEPVVLLIEFADRLAQIGPAVRLAGVN